MHTQQKTPSKSSGKEKKEGGKSCQKKNCITTKQHIVNTFQTAASDADHSEHSFADSHPQQRWHFQGAQR